MVTPGSMTWSTITNRQFEKDRRIAGVWTEARSDGSESGRRMCTEWVVLGEGIRLVFLSLIDSCRCALARLRAQPIDGGKVWVRRD